MSGTYNHTTHRKSAHIASLMASTNKDQRRATGPYAKKTGPNTIVGRGGSSSRRTTTASTPQQKAGRIMTALEIRKSSAEARTALLGGENSAVAHMLGVDKDAVDRIAGS